MVGQARCNEPKACCSPRASHCAAVCSMGRRKEKAGREESRLWNQRRRVEGSGRRLGFERWRGVFPRASLHKAPPQCLAARDQTVVGVWQGESRKETKYYTAQRTQATAVPDPIVTLIMGLLLSPAMADDRMEQAERTPAKNQSCIGRPVESQLAMVGKKWG
jgi:hypothetical protein